MHVRVHQPGHDHTVPRGNLLRITHRRDVTQRLDHSIPDQEVSPDELAALLYESPRHHQRPIHDRAAVCSGALMRNGPLALPNSNEWRTSLGMSRSSMAFRAVATTRKG